MKKINNMIDSLSKAFIKFFNENSEKYSKAEVENADGRKEKNNISKQGSFLYVAFNENKVLYVGETGKSIKNRFITDGSGAHKQKNWYAEFEYVKILKLDNDDIQVRKLLEQSLSISMQPKYYDGKIYNNTLDDE